jgi:hypothetical protein
MLPQVKLLDEMDESMGVLLQRNLAGITQAEADWRPHAAANSVRLDGRAPGVGRGVGARRARASGALNAAGVEHRSPAYPRRPVTFRAPAA